MSEVPLRGQDLELRAYVCVSLLRSRDISRATGKVNGRLPGKGNSSSHGASPVHLIITITKWIRTRRLLIKNSLSRADSGFGVSGFGFGFLVWGLGFLVLGVWFPGSGFRVSDSTFRACKLGNHTPLSLHHNTQSLIVELHTRHP